MSCFCACSQKVAKEKIFRTGAERTEAYFPMLKSKNIAVVANATTVIGKVHLVDSLLHAGFEVKKVFAPEHGFRGTTQAGEKVDNAKDEKSGLPIISLYGKHQKPTAEDLKGIDIVIFDIQDVGTRFYTYTSTMTYVMEACAENNVEMLVLDRPNPNGSYVDGPVLEPEFRSFVGLHPVPVVHGLTIAEYARMINGEGWLKDSIKCWLKYITMENYTHSMCYNLPVNPSPNLPNDQAICLYPSLCFFEGTVVSVGRGTPSPFTIIGHPDYPIHNFSFTPKAAKGSSVKPLFENVCCYGINLADSACGKGHIQLQWMLHMYKVLPDKELFFNNFFDKLAGTSKLREQIIMEIPEEEIRESWQPALEKYRSIRRKYLLYK